MGQFLSLGSIAIPGSWFAAIRKEINLNKINALLMFVAGVTPLLVVFRPSDFESTLHSKQL
jgi:hypothetical protein